MLQTFLNNPLTNQIKAHKYELKKLNNDVYQNK